MSDIIEYRVRPVTRYIVTRYVESEYTGESECIGEFHNEAQAERVMFALHRGEPGSVLVAPPPFPSPLPTLRESTA